MSHDRGRNRHFDSVLRRGLITKPPLATNILCKSIKAFDKAFIKGSGIVGPVLTQSAVSKVG